MRVLNLVAYVFGTKSPRCPFCGHPGAHRSHRTGPREHLLSLLYLYPFRCGQCSQRFLAFSVGRWKKKPGVPDSEEL